MPAPDREQRFQRWLKLISEMHAAANFTPNDTIAWTPMHKPLAESTIALVSTAGVHLKSQPVFDLLSHHGDTSFREIPGNTAANELAVHHVHYDTTDTNADPNCVFPIDRLHELAQLGIVKAVAPMNFGLMGFIRCKFHRVLLSCSRHEISVSRIIYRAFLNHRAIVRIAQSP